jgi:hypothetical protein
MALPGTPTPFYPRGLYDSLDGSTSPDGSCFVVQNMIHDITTQRTWTPRPGAVVQTTFPIFSGPTFVSAGIAVGTKIYGMLATLRNPGNDEPFVYDVSNASFTTVINVTAANTPATQATTGDWVPPTMAVVGTRVLVTHPGFSGSNFFGWFDISSFSLVFTASTHSNTLLDTTSVNPLNVGIQIGQRITGTGIPVNTFVVGYTSTTITLSQAATATAAGVSITAAGGTVAAPLWGAGNTNTNPLPSAPQAVMQFYNRAYYAVVNQAWFSDALAPNQITNATNFVTCGQPGYPIVGFGGIPITQTTGGILAALIIFKGSGGYYQLTGDLTTSNLQLNGPVGNVGCAAARSIAQTPTGLWFMSRDGVRQIGFDGLISTAPIKAVRFPFNNSVEPTRASAAYNNTVYRVSTRTLPNLLVEQPSLLDWWFDYEIEEWEGPQTCGNSLIIPISDTFYFASVDNPGALYRSDVDVAPQGTVYTEFGNPLVCQMTSCLLPQTNQMAASAIVEATLDMTLVGGQAVPTVSFFDSQGSILATATLPTPSTIAPVWGTDIWGAFNWGAQPSLSTYNVDWPIPLVFKKGSWQVTSTAYGGLRVGVFWYRIEDLGYMNTQQPA